MRPCSVIANVFISNIAIAVVSAVFDRETPSFHALTVASN